MLIVMLAMMLQSAQEPGALSGKDAVGNVASWFTANDYPPAALRAYESGTTGFTLVIGADDKATDCRVTLSSGSRTLDTTTCTIMTQRATFQPGAPARTYSSRITWKMPPLAQPVEVTADFPGSVVVETEVVIGTGGVVESCRIISAPKALGDPCMDTHAGQRQGSGFRKDGKPVKAVLRKRFSVVTTFVAP